MGKFFIPVWPSEHLKAFMALGVDYTMQQDTLENINSWSPTFGVGMDWRLTPNFKTTLEFEYVTGNGASTFDPVNQYVPFLYNVGLRMAYLF